MGRMVARARRKAQTVGALQKKHRKKKQQKQCNGERKERRKEEKKKRKKEGGGRCRSSRPLRPDLDLGGFREKMREKKRNDSGPRVIFPFVFLFCFGQWQLESWLFVDVEFMVNVYHFL